MKPQSRFNVWYWVAAFAAILAIQVFFFDWGRTDWGPIFAALSVGSIPMIVVYVLMQRRFVQGLTAGAVKG